MGGDDIRVDFVFLAWAKYDNVELPCFSEPCTKDQLALNPGFRVKMAVVSDKKRQTLILSGHQTIRPCKDNVSLVVNRKLIMGQPTTDP